MNQKSSSPHLRAGAYGYVLEKHRVSGIVQSHQNSDGEETYMSHRPFPDEYDRHALPVHV